jgi:PAS domain S-box-containing protein
MDRWLAALGTTMTAYKTMVQGSGTYVKLLAALTIAAILLSVGFLLWGLRDREINHARMETANLTQMVVQQSERQFETMDMVLKGVQERLQTPFGIQQDLSGQTVRLLLNSRVAGLHQVRSLSLLDTKGILVNTSGASEPPALTFADADFFQRVQQLGGDGLVIGRPVRNGDDSGWTLNLARPLLTEDGHFRGVAVVAVDLAAFEKMFSVVQLDYVRPIALYLSDGTLFASWPHRENAMGQLAPEWGNLLQRDPTATVRSVDHMAEDGTKLAYAMGHLSGFPIRVSVADDAFQRLVAWRETAWPISIGALLVSIFTTLVATYLVGKLRIKHQLTMALTAADARYQHTVNAVMDAIVAVDETMRIVLFNPSAEMMFGHTASEVTGQTLDVLIPERLRAVHRTHMRAFSQGEETSRAASSDFEILGLRADGTEFPLESTLSRSVIGGKMQMTAVLRDVSKHGAAEAELRLANGQLRELSASLQSVREEERKRISRELHDDLGQQLTGLKLSLSWLGSRLKDGKPTTVSDVDEMRHQMDTAIGSVRRIATELRPRVLDDLDFREALSWQAQDMLKHSGIQVELDLRDADWVQDDGLATALFRIVQEALTNVVRHAQATKVQVTLGYYEQALLLSIQDNGCGFDPGVSSGGIGLVSMRERCAAIGAGFVVRSSKGAGTVLEVRVPVEEDIALQAA